MGINDFFHNMLDRFYIYQLNDTLMVDSLEPNDIHAIRINKKQSKLYCIELVSGGTTANYLSSQKVDNIFESFAYLENGRLYQAYLKKGQMQRNLIFSNNQDLLSLIVKGVDGRFLEDEEIVNVLYDLFLGNEYNIKKKELHSIFSMTKELNYNNISHSFNGFVKDSIYMNMKKMKVYQSYRFKNRKKPIDLSHLYSLDFDGVIWTVLEFNKENINYLLSEKKTQAKTDGNDEELKQLYKAYNSDDIYLAVGNSSIFMLRGNVNVVPEISNSLGIDYAQKEIPLENSKYLKNTPLLLRDSYFDSIITKDFLYNYFSCVHKEDVSNPNFYGTDINGRFWNFRFDQTTESSKNKNADFVILGVKGSGKTTFTNGILAQTFNYGMSEDRIFRIGDPAQGMNENKLRHFDIKKSGMVLAKLIKNEFPKNVKFINTSLDEFLYNPINITHKIKEDGTVVIDQNELTLNILLLSIVLESKNKIKDAVGLDASEQALLKNIITELYISQNYECDYILALKEVNFETYNELITLGYDELSNIKDISHVGYEFLKAPTLETVYKNIGIVSKEGGNENIQKISLSLESKIKTILSIGIFSGLDKIDYANASFLHIDFDPIKELDEYVPIFLSLFLKLYRMDKLSQLDLLDKGIDRPYITYVFEEAKNVLSQDSFEDFIAKFINEARSYRIKVGFTTQLISHVPSHIFTQVENKFLLFPGKNKRNMLIDEITTVAKMDDKTIELMHRTPEYGIVLWNEHGSSSFKPAMSDKEIEAYGQAQ